MEEKAMRIPDKARRFIRSRSFLLIVLLVLMVLFFWYFSPKNSYLRITNIVSILNSMVLFIIFAVAVSFPILLGEFDLSPGYIGTAAGAALATILLETSIPWYIAVIVCLILGIVFGLINALLINKFLIQSFIATLAVGSFIARGVSLIVPSGRTLRIDHPVFDWVGDARLLNNIPVTVVISLVVIIIYGTILSKTNFGRSIYLCGGNRQAARLAGLNPKRLSYIVFANSGMLGALAGLLLAARIKPGNLDGTNAYAFPTVTAAIFGGISFGGGSGSMLGCFLGLLVLCGFQNGLLIMRFSPHWQSIAAGVLLLLALSLDYVSKRRTMKLEVNKVSRTTEKSAFSAPLDQE
jgi:ribose/xylose/arabinose/galactoside ABC-type transport system permease subunit